MQPRRDSPALTIRPLDEDGDRAAFTRMAREVVADGTVFPFEHEDGVHGYWFASGARRFVAADAASGEVLGTYVLRPNMPDRCAHVANAGYLVAEAARGRGVGEAMGRHSLTLARELGFRAMQFNLVVAQNKPAVALWEKLGFETVGMLRGAFRHRTDGFVDALVMYRLL